jgi:hypothetical protein
MVNRFIMIKGQVCRKPFFFQRPYTFFLINIIYLLMLTFDVNRGKNIKQNDMQKKERD